MKIYVGTYKKYNEGSIFGKWFDLTNYYDLSNFYKDCKELHKDEIDPELMFQDWENIPEQLIGESYLDENIFEYVEFIQKCDYPEAFEIYVEDRGDINEAIKDFEEAFCGVYSCKLEFGEQLFDNIYLGDVPNHIAYYIDYVKFTRDLFLGDYFFKDGFVFRNL